MLLPTTTDIQISADKLPDFIKASDLLVSYKTGSFRAATSRPQHVLTEAWRPVAAGSADSRARPDQSSQYVNTSLGPVGSVEFDIRDGDVPENVLGSCRWPLLGQLSGIIRGGPDEVLQNLINVFSKTGGPSVDLIEINQSAR